MGETIMTITDILHSYEKKRLDNKRILQERQDEIYKKIPRISEIDKESKISYIAQAKAKILNKDSSELGDSSKNNRLLTKEKQELLVQNGYPANYLDEIFCCEKCKDTGYVDQKRCSCFTAQIIDSLYLQSNLKNILAVENFDTFKVDYYSKEVNEGMTYSPYENISNILKKSKTFINDFDSLKKKGNILMYGETGLGKTFLTNCIAKELLDKGHSVLYLSSNQLFETVIAGYLLNQKKELEELYKCIYNTELLVIDDLGTELTNNFVLSHLFEIINQRNCLGVSTLISTNLSIQQLRDRYSERIMSRIVDNYTVFHLYGDNIRYQKRKNALKAN